jgi:hypothetical protein
MPDGHPKRTDYCSCVMATAAAAHWAAEAMAIMSAERVNGFEPRATRYEQTACTLAPLWSAPGSTTVGGSGGTTVAAGCALLDARRSSPAVCLGARGRAG